MMHALQVLGDAVSRDNVEDYRAALAHAREIGASQEQINDAWQYRAVRRLDTTLPPVSFDVDGNLRD